MARREGRERWYNSRGERWATALSGDGVGDDGGEELLLGRDIDVPVLHRLLDGDAVARAEHEELEEERRGGAAGSLRGNSHVSV